MGAPRTTAADVLRKAHEALSGSPDAWLPQMPFTTLDESDRSCPASSENAVRWGFFAALVRVRASDAVRLEADDFLKRAIGVHMLVIWAEAPGRTLADIVIGLERAIALAEVEGRP